MEIVSLTAAFLAHVGPARDALIQAAADLERTLAAMLAAGRAAWPGIVVPDDVFLQHLAERLPGDGDPLAALAHTHASDLYLACACARGDAAAVRAFDQHFIAQVSTYLTRTQARPGVADEIEQRLRARLLVGDERLGPRIAAYSGRGPLGAWLRVAATREAQRLGASPESYPLDRVGEIAVAADPELAYLKAHYGDDLAAAFAHTLSALEPREGAVLRLYYLEGMTADAIGMLYRVTSRTVQRWIAETREKILSEAHRRLAERLHLPRSEVEGLFGLLQSQIDVSIWRFLDEVSPPRR